MDGIKQDFHKGKAASPEKQLETQGITTAREIEKALRWDGVTYSCAGLGNQFVRNYLKTHPVQLDQSSLIKNKLGGL